MDEEIDNNFEIEQLDGSLDEIIDRLTKFKEKHKNKNPRLYLLTDDYVSINLVYDV